MPPDNLKGTAWKKLREFADMVSAFSAEVGTANAHALGLAIAKRSGLVHALYSDKTPEGVARYENVQELLNALQGFVENPANEDAQSLSDFLIDVALLTDADNDDDDDNKVSLMTVHAAKGSNSNTCTSSDWKSSCSPLRWPWKAVRNLKKNDASFTWH